MLERFARSLMVREGEFARTGYLLLLFLLLGAGTALGRGSTDALFFKRYGIEYLPVMYVIFGVLLCLVTTGYAAYADRIPAERLYKILLTTLIGLLLSCRMVMSLPGNEIVYPIYYLVYEVASELLLLHGGVYLHQNLETQQAKRLTPLILAGGQVGSIAGGLFLALQASALGVQNMLVAWAVLLLAGVLLLTRWHARQGASPYYRAGRKDARRLQQAVTQIGQGLRFMRTSALVRASSIALFFTVIAFYILCYSVNRIYTAAMPTEESLTAFFGVLAAVNGGIALTMQLFLTNRVLHRFGVKTVNLIFPLSTGLCYATLLSSFTLPAALLGSLNKDAIMPAFRNPVRNLFFNALPGYMQGRARAISVGLVLPLALVVCGAILWAAQRFQDPRHFLVLGALATLVYLYYNLRMNRAYVSEIITHLKQKLFVPDDHQRIALRNADDSVLQELTDGVMHADERISIAFARTLAAALPQRAPEILLQRLDGAGPALRDQLFRLLIPLNPPAFRDYLWRELAQSDGHLRATALRTLFALGDERTPALIGPALADANPRIRAAAVFGALRLGREPAAAQAAWLALVTSPRLEERFCALDLITCPMEQLAQGPALQQGYRTLIVELLDGSERRARLAALRALARRGTSDIAELPALLNRGLDDPDAEIRRATVRCLALLPEPQRLDAVLQALEDGHPSVRAAALELIDDGSEHAAERLLHWITVDNRGTPRAQATMLAALIAAGPREQALAEITRAKAHDAHLVSHALRMLHQHRPHGSATELLIHSLRERVAQLVDLALQALQPLEHATDIALVRAGIGSRDARHRANACEVLRNLHDRKLGALLAALIEDPESGNAARNEDAAPFHDTGGVLAWCRTRNDPWLALCARHTMEVVSE